MSYVHAIIVLLIFNIQMGITQQSTDIFFAAIVRLTNANWLLSKSVSAYLDSLKLGPYNAVVYVKLALVYYDQGLIELAIDTLRSAIEIQSNYFDAYFYLGNALNEKGQLKEAEECYDIVLKLNSSHAHTLQNLGDIKRTQGHIQNAVQLYTKALEIFPDFETVHWKLASIYFEYHMFSVAIAYYENYLKLKSNSFDAQCQIIHCKRKSCYWINWDSSINKMISIVTEQLKKNQMPCIGPFQLMSYPMTHSLRKAIAKRRAAYHLENIKNLHKTPYKHIKNLAPDNRLRIGYMSSELIHHSTAHLMQSIPGLHNKSKFEIFCYALSANDNSTFRSKMASESEHFIDLSQISCNGRAADIIYNDGIHILINMEGYSGEGKNDIFALSPAPIQVLWLTYPGTTGASFVDYIITDIVTSPIDFASQYTEKFAYMPHTYLIGDHKQMFSHLCERIILSNKNHCKKNIADNVAILNGIDLSPIIESTNIEEIIYVIQSEIVNSNCIKSNEIIFKVAELSNFTQIRSMIDSNEIETLINGVVVKNGLITTDIKIANGEKVMNSIVITTRQQYDLPEDSVVYCYFNQLYKLDPQTFEMWLNILKAVPKSVLWMLRFPPDGEPNILSTAAKFGIGPDRIIFSDTVGKEEHVRRGQLADICLDTPLFNGHTTSMDILWSGTPIVTLPRETFASRVAASLLTTLGCPELIAKTEEEYQDIAIRLGTDNEFLRNIRAKIWQARLESPLFNCSMYTNDLESLYRAMWDKYDRGEKPNHILSLENY